MVVALWENEYMAEPDRSPDRMAAAYYHAGWAIVSHYVGRQAIGISIAPNARGKYARGEPVPKKLPPMTTDEAKRDIMVSLAGGMAEEMYSGGTENAVVSRSDWQRARGNGPRRAWLVAERAIVNENERNSFLNDLAAKVHKVLESRWDFVRTLAEELIYQTVLTERQVRKELSDLPPGVTDTR
ncbi:MAG TPA: hypothetical protein VGG64_21105 [Pirellulales bacterium]|jgi:hypothetical protein